MPRLKPIDRVRKICLALPQATEKLAWGEPTFRTGAAGKMFVMFANNHHNDGRVAIWCNAAPGTQDLLVRANPDRFFVPPYMGPSGWVCASKMASPTGARSRRSSRRRIE